MATRLERMIKCLGDEDLRISDSAVSSGQISDMETSQQEIVDVKVQAESIPGQDDKNQAFFEEHGHFWWEAPALTQRPKATYGHPANSRDRPGFSTPSGMESNSYSPFIAVTKFCYKFLPKALVQPVASAVFDEGKIYQRQWKIYYVDPAHYLPANGKPLTFVPELQFLALLDDINQEFPDAKARITEELREEGVVINFDDFGGPKPFYLGRVDSKEQYELLLENLLAGEGTVSSKADFPIRLAFEEKMQLADAATKNKKNAAKKRQKGDARSKPLKVAGLKSAQEALGLVPQAGTFFETTPVLIAVDVEAYERASSIITEVGVATLDVRDLDKIAPGKDGIEWQSLIRARHLRIKEHKNYVNKDFVRGCPERFDFGSSEWVDLDDVASVVASCFHEPFSKQASNTQSSDESERRRIILVGHDIGQDLAYLRKIGIDPTNRGNLTEMLDTATIDRAYTGGPNPRSLASICYDFDFDSWNPHNAGNDAVYTLWALIAMCLRSSTINQGPGVDEKC